MKKQEIQSEPGSMSEELGDVLSRFKAWQATNGRKSESEGTDVDTSWKLVYGQALDSISQLGSSVELSAPIPSLVSPSLGAPSLVSGSPAAPSLTLRRVEDSVTDTVSLSTRGPRPANPSGFLTPPSASIMKGEISSARIEEAFPARSIKPAPAPPAPDVLYFRPPTFSAKSATAAAIVPVQPVRNPSVEKAPVEKTLVAKAPVEKTPVEKQVVQEPQKSSARPRYNATARSRSAPQPKPATNKLGLRRRQELAPSAGNALQKAALLKQKATEACITISTYLEQSESEVQRLRGKANDLRLDMDTVRCSILSITQPQAGHPVAKSAMSKTPEAQPVAMVPAAASLPVPASIPACETAPVLVTVPSFSIRLKRRLLGLVGVASEI